MKIAKTFQMFIQKDFISPWAKLYKADFVTNSKFQGLYMKYKQKTDRYVQVNIFPH